MKKKPTLFKQLFLYFGVIIAIPSLIFAAYALVTGQIQLNRDIKNEAEINIVDDLETFSQIIEEYRHKTYEISKNDNLISLLSKSKDDDKDSKGIYSKLFDVMKGDTYKASLSVVSTDGLVRLSTHIFPKRYDVRYYNTESDITNPITWNIPSTQTSISIINRYINDTGNQIALTFLRNVFDKNGKNLGYVIIDVYDVRLNNLINKRNFFDDTIVINKKEFYAASLTDSSSYGNFSKFSFLSKRPENLETSNIIKDEYLYSIKEVVNTDLIVMGVIDLAHYNDNFLSVMKILSIALIIGLLFGVILAYHFSRNISKSINNVIDSMHKVEEGNMAIDIRSHDIKEMEELNDNFNMMVVQLVKLVKHIQEDDRKYAESEMKSLEAQLNPHFLFNTLNTIKALARINNQEEIYEIAIKLGTLLRSNLNNSKTTSTVDESISLVNDYLTIQKIRFGEKLKVSYDVDDEIANNVIPKLIIQPLVENAINHGLETKMGDWIIHISCKKIDDRIIIKVRDNGVGLPSDFNSDFASFKKTTHVGLYNIYRRLIIHYEGKIKFTINNCEDEFTEALISLPLTSRINNFKSSTEND
jgi:two-component system sensor histidine kinase YesM